MCSFVNELKKRAEPDKVLYFLRVEGRGLSFPLHGMLKDYKKFFVVPGMILMVIKETMDTRGEDSLIVKWCGPALETDLKSSNVDEYSENRTFIIDIPMSNLINGSVVKVTPDKVTKMKNHVPAVLY